MAEIHIPASGVWASFKSLQDGGDINANTSTMREINRTVNEAEEIEELPEVVIDTAALFDPARRLQDVPGQGDKKPAKIGAVEPGQETRASEEFKSEGVTRPTITIEEFKKVHQPSFAASPLFGAIEKLQPDIQSQIMGGILDFTSNTIEGVGALFGEGVDGRLRNLATKIPMIEKSDKIGASLARGVTQFSMAFIPALGATSKLLQGSSMASKGIIADQAASAFADFFSQSGGDKKLSNVILEKMPGLRNWEHVGSLLQYLEGDPGDSELKGRWKNVLEGQLLNSLTGIVPNAKKVVQDFGRVVGEVQKMNFYHKYLDNQVGAIGQGANRADPMAGSISERLTPQQEARKAIGDVDTNLQLANESASRKKINPVKLSQDAKRKQIPLEELDNLAPDVVRSDVQRLAFSDAMTANNKGIVESGKKLTKDFTDANAMAEFSQRMEDIPALMAKYVGEDSELGKQILRGNFKSVGSKNQGVGRIMQVVDVYKNATPDQQIVFAERMSRLPERKVMRYVKLTGAYLNNGKPWQNAAAEAYVASLLATPLTQATNAIANSVSTVGLVAERAIAGAISQYTPFASGSPITVTESAYLAHGILSSIGAGMEAYKHAWINSLKGPGLIDLNNKADVFSPAIAAGPLGFEGTSMEGLVNWLGHVARLPLTNLQATDAFYKTLLTQGEMQALAYREALSMAKSAEGALTDAQFKEMVKTNYRELIDNPTDELLKRSEDFAAFGTFTDKFISPMAKGFQSTLSAHPSLKLVVPFWQTPVRISQANLKRVPVIGAFLRDSQELGAHSVAERRALSIAKQTTGIIMATTMGQLAYNQNIIGNGPGPKDQKARELLDARGIKPLSVPTEKDEQGNVTKSIPFTKFTGQYGIVMRMGADLIDLVQVMYDKAFNDELTPEIQEAYDDYFSGWVATTSKIFEDQVFFRNLTNILSDAKNGNTNSLERFVASPLPRMLEEVAKGFDPMVKETDTLLELVMSKIPGLRDKVQSKSDLFGQDYVDGMGVFSEQNPPKTVGFLATRVNPAHAYGNFNPELQPLFDYFGQFEQVLPGSSGEKNKIGNVKLDSEQKAAFKKVRAGFDFKTNDGLTIKAAVLDGFSMNEKLLSIVKDDSLSDLFKVSSINKWVQGFTQETERIMRGHYPELNKEIIRQQMLGSEVIQATME